MERLPLSFFASPQMGALLAQECRVLAPELARAHGIQALTLELSGMPALSSPLRHGVRLCVNARGGVVGDLRASVAELPFADGSMDLLVLRHVAEYVAEPSTLAAEALRVLAADGIIVITGMHPYSLWHAWLRRHAERTGENLRPVLPGRWRTWLADADADVSSLLRFGPSLPGQSEARFHGAGLLAAGYVMVGRKRRQPPAVARMVRSPRRLAVGSAMPGGARRERA